MEVKKELNCKLVGTEENVFLELLQLIIFIFNFLILNGFYFFD